MRFLLLLLVAMSLTLAWQSSVVAAIDSVPACSAAEDGKKGQETTGSTEDEPECD